MTKALDWVHPYERNRRSGRERDARGRAEDRQELARMLDILSCDALKVSYTLDALEKLTVSG